ncbi:molybdopterin molybdotransferase MoeA [Rubinisphaera italica]|uniref:Molybdopterin molybdenumtransferase n=1 Tax=Rubinisphaera italica TaxID=2527969 RepID=A0A5C5XHA9_9PLAN|nr:gephyrin-like molybdotransferase Glp [Rubinisphaera italica]TWT62214.1 Molybdopterin molybdenumtransferase [Rubinisphaera italica]
MLSVSEAFQLIEQTILPASVCEVPLSQAAGRVSACDVISDSDSPPFNKALMDGFAIRTLDIQDDVRLKVIERITAGEVPQCSLEPGTAIQVMTGAQLPAGTDAVIRIEDVLTPEEDEISFTIDSISPGRNVMSRGESMQMGEVVVACGERLAFPKIALLAELGRSKVSIIPQPSVAVLATGNELVPIDQTPGPGQIRNSNETMLVAQVENAGVKAVPLGIARDDRDDLRSHMKTGLQSDFLLLSGGVSAGVLDLVPSVLAELGVQQVFHKVHMKPGKPIWFGVRPADAENSRPCYVFGLPGNPVSSMVCCELFVKFALNRIENLPGLPAESRKARLRQAHLVKGDRPVYYPARITHNDHELTATPVRWVGSADLRGASEANGMILFTPRDAEYQENEIVDVWKWIEII